jgi:hypothetical protein
VGEERENGKMNKNSIIQWSLAVVLLGLLSTQSTFGQPIPPVNTNTPPHIGTNTFDYGAYYSNNLASVSEWLHDSVNNPDGTPASSFQDLMDLQATAFSTSGTFSWQESARDEALSWANFNGIPDHISGPNGTTAYLVGREGNVPNYIVAFDLASAITMNTTNVWPGGSTGFSLTGTNTIISQWDEASPRLTHSEFGSRVTELYGNTNLSDHSTAVAGILTAIGNTVFSNSIPIGPAAKGMAYQAQVQARDFISDMSEMTVAAGTNHTRLSNHSYGSIQGWYQDATGQWYWFGNAEISTNQDPKFGNYTTNAASYDVIAVGAPTYLQVWAAENSLSNGPSILTTNHIERDLSGNGFFTTAKRPLDGDQGGYDSLSQQACAKDTLTVGAVFPLPNGYASPTNLIFAPFSSCGPTDDGRIKPDVVADGINNITPVSGSDFAYGQWPGGTSFASPSVAGSVGLLTQFYKQLHPKSSDPLASTLKGLVIETADSGTTNYGPSYRFGWGLMNTKTAATLINQDATNGLKNQIKEVLLPNGQFIQFPVVSAGSTNSPLKVTICWTDPVGAPNSITNLDNPTPKLVNDLDLRIFAPNGTTNFPWVLNPDLTNRTSAARSAAATKGDDSRNNVEQIYVPNSTNGTYTVTVTHKGNLQSNGVQWVSILLNGNVAQQPPPLKFNQIIQTGTNQMAVGWPAVVGEQYQVQANNDLTTTNWFNVGGIISARLTNVVTQVSKTNCMQFYRIVQLP